MSDLHSRFLVNIVFLCLYFTTHVSAKKSCDFNIKVQQNLLNEGFHRNITYGIVFNTDKEEDVWLYRGCIVALDQPLPPGVYLNPDELNEFRRIKKLNAVTKNRINIELPTEESESSNVYIFGRIKQDKAYLWLPVHARYHKAVKGGGTARNTVKSPKLYLRCPDQRLDVCDKALSPDTFLCNGSSKEKCSWKQIPFTMVTEPLIWDVPVGDLDHYYTVAVGTGLVVVMGSVYLLQAAHEYQTKRRERAV
ncbi:phosphatidylinositol-glycan biosynthesis class X protein [Ostrinia nubilalis]|uniref:phosphatidylinositol-glycan biosynthesis class X protein n=1 Tax=Ostrinia nubilalis TaxID=29057 RepID=UPI0030825BCF